MNPLRHCRLCKIGRDYLPLLDKISVTKDENAEGFWAISGDDLMDLVGGCPACALTLCRLFRQRNAKDCEYLDVVKFNYEGEIKKWWDDKNDELDRREYERY